MLVPMYESFQRLETIYNKFHYLYEKCIPLFIKNIFYSYRLRLLNHGSSYVQFRSIKKHELWFYIQPRYIGNDFCP